MRTLEPQSFASALKNAFAARASACGHQVTMSDLYAMGFNPVSGRHNFSTVAQPAGYRQHDEEAFVPVHDGFVAELSTVMNRSTLYRWTAPIPCLKGLAICHADHSHISSPLWGVESRGRRSAAAEEGLSG
jgi:hypothetical protein